MLILQIIDAVLDAYYVVNATDSNYADGGRLHTSTIRSRGRRATSILILQLIDDAIDAYYIVDSE